jgi:hypothetical protein
LWFLHREKTRINSGHSQITECGTIIAVKGSSESAGRRQEGGEVLMNKIILFLLIGLVGWWIGNLMGQGGYQQLLETEPSGLDMIFGVVGSSASGYVFLDLFGAQ